MHDLLNQNNLFAFSTYKASTLKLFFCSTAFLPHDVHRDRKGRADLLLPHEAKVYNSKTTVRPSLLPIASQALYLTFLKQKNQPDSLSPFKIEEIISILILQDLKQVAKPASTWNITMAPRVDSACQTSLKLKNVFQKVTISFARILQSPAEFTSILL